jgi:CHAT domain-containing protein/tetratricopeptide (TPR) repeat protein
MSSPSTAAGAFLRKLSVHLWAFAKYWRASLHFVIRVSNATTTQTRNELFGNYIRSLLDTADIVLQKRPQSAYRWLRNTRLFLRSWYYTYIVLSVAIPPREWQSNLSQDDLLRLIRIGKQALQDYLSGGAAVIAASRRWKGIAAILGRELRCLYRSFFEVSLASLYLRVNAGDLAHNLETAFSHYLTAAETLEAENLPVLSLYAAVVRVLLGIAYLQYPTERSEEFAGLALELFARAKRITDPYLDCADASTQIIWNDTFWRTSSFWTRLKRSFLISSRVGWGGFKMAWSGVPDHYVTALLLPLFVFWVDWRIGVAHRQLGQIDKAIEHFELALQALPSDSGDFRELRIAVEIDRGFAYLETRGGDRKSSLHMAIESFKVALGGCVKAGRVRTAAARAYALAMIGDARTFFDLFARATKPDNLKKLFPSLVSQLRSAAKVARAEGLPEISQEALYLLGRAFELQGDYLRAFYALAASLRVADRIGTRARTPRMLRYLVGQQAPLYALLVRMALYAPSQSRKVASEKFRKVKIVPLHYALEFAERGRTVFLSIQLQNLQFVPPGSADGELSGLFARRRLWHEAELKLFEQAWTPSADKKVIHTLRERRNVLESEYFAELGKVREKRGDQHYDPDRPVLPVRAKEMQVLVRQFSKDVGTALVEYFFTDRKLVVFILLPGSLRMEYVGISRDELAAIEEHWEKGREALDSSPQHWEKGYLQQVLDRLQLAADTPAKSIAAYEAQTGRHIGRIIIVPHRFLHLVPLHAIELSNGKRWGEEFSIQYAPSGSLLWQLFRSRSVRKAEIETGERSRRPDRRKTLSICYSSCDGGPPLLFGREEARSVVEAMGGEMISGEEATPRRVKEAMQDATYVHFACHATFDRFAPLEAGLILAPEQKGTEAACGESDNGTRTSPHTDGRLSAAEIFRSLHLPRGELVVLSACETGVTRVEEHHEEYLGLPAAFLCAGASTVVSTLWPVADVGTWILMRAFVQHTAAGRAPSLALRCAQQELRSLTTEQAQELIVSAADREKDPSRRELMLNQQRQLSGPFPLSSPYWWAGFTVNGLADVIMRPDSAPSSV